MAEAYDVIILGGGPAGLTAGLYAARSRLKALLLERGLPGGQIVNADRVENYPGFPQGISGTELGQRMLDQAVRFGLTYLTEEVTEVALGRRVKAVSAGRKDYEAPSLILATGAEHRKLGVPGETELLGKGVSYCALCDAPFFRDQEVVVVGGGDVAINDALYLARFASRVTIIHRRRELRASTILQERAKVEPRINFQWNSVVEKIVGNGQVEGLELRRVDTGQKQELKANGLFVAIGSEPNTHFLEGKMKLGQGGVVPTNEFMETEVPGVFAAGDIRLNSPRQAITAAGDGATAALSVVSYLREAR